MKKVPEILLRVQPRPLFLLRQIPEPEALLRKDPAEPGLPARLFLCLNERILKKKATIINTNLSLEQLSRIYSERVFSRLVESYRILRLYGDDIRLKKAFSTLDER